MTPAWPEWSDNSAKCREFVYLATPYSKYPGGLEAAFRLACEATGLLIRAGIGVYSPIAHTHPVAMASGLDPLDHAIWLPADAPMMAAAGSLIVVMADTWERSYGIGEEIKAFQAAGKPISYWPWPGPVASIRDTAKMIERVDRQRGEAAE